VTFADTTPIHVERPLARGEAVEVLHAPTNPHLATVGLRVEPAPADSGVAFRLDVDPRSAPLYAYKTFDGFGARMEEYVRDALQSGLYGWRVTDCVVTLTECAYSVPDGPPSRRGPLSSPSDFRKLTPLVLRRALALAGTAVCEPMVRATLEVPSGSVGAVVPALVRLGAAVDPPTLRGPLATVEALVAAARLHALQRRLPALTAGEGSLETSFAGYRPVGDDPPTRKAP
jgi:ribosomal protection tetracycline resistance protein